MIYKIEDIEGVGTIYGEKLRAVGINNANMLLEKCASKAGRTALAKDTGINEKLILKWTNHADLFRVKGIGPEYAELLEASGVDTVKELHNRVAENLHSKMVETNEEKHLVRQLPYLSQVEAMIENAKTLEPKMSY